MVEHYIGIDLHKAFFQVCAVDGFGLRCWEDRFPTTTTGIAAFLERTPADVEVAVEASGPTWHFVDALHGRLARVVVVDAAKTRWKAGYAVKTDRLDARRLADALRRDSVATIYYPPPPIRELRELCRHRRSLVRTQTGLKHRESYRDCRRANYLRGLAHGTTKQVFLGGTRTGRSHGPGTRS